MYKGSPTINPGEAAVITIGTFARYQTASITYSNNVVQIDVTGLMLPVVPELKAVINYIPASAASSYAGNFGQYITSIMAFSPTSSSGMNFWFGHPDPNLPNT